MALPTTPSWLPVATVSWDWANPMSYCPALSGWFTRLGWAPGIRLWRGALNKFNTQMSTYEMACWDFKISTISTFKKWKKTPTGLLFLKQLRCQSSLCIPDKDYRGGSMDQNVCPALSEAVFLQWGRPHRHLQDWVSEARHVWGLVLSKYSRVHCNPIEGSHPYQKRCLKHIY